MAARATMQIRIKRAEEEMRAARVAFAVATPEFSGAVDVSDKEVFNALRPKGDLVIVISKRSWGGPTTETPHEVETVTATQVKLVGHKKPFKRSDGEEITTRSGYADRIRKTDLKRIQAGKVLGWRDRPWAK